MLNTNTHQVNANENLNEMPLHTPRMTKIRCLSIPDISEDIK